MIWKCQAGGGRQAAAPLSVSCCIGGKSSGGEPASSGREGEGGRIPPKFAGEESLLHDRQRRGEGGPPPRPPPSTPLLRLACMHGKTAALAALQRRRVKRRHLCPQKSRRLVCLSIYPTRVFVSPRTSIRPSQSNAIVSLHLYGGGLTPELSQVRVHGNQRRRRGAEIRDGRR